MAQAARAPSAVIFGCAGPVLNAAERAFFTETNPLGFILFKRNVETPEQVKTLVNDLRAAAGRADAPVLIDQEGGRVQRLGPPHWPAYPPGAVLARVYRDNPETGLEAASLHGRLIADDLWALGIDVDCAPVLDVPQPGAHDVIGDRALGATAETVTAVGRAFADGLRAGGVTPVIKHIPGHGRAAADSHKSLPVVSAPLAELEAVDFAPFKALSETLWDAPWGMTAHVVYEALDNTAPATTSARVINDIVRGAVGFQGFLVSDDLSMRALSGSFEDRARACLSAGCDAVLHCNGDMDEMRAAAAGARPLTPASLARLERARAMVPPPLSGAPGAFDRAAAKARYNELTERFR
ncbi:MAG: beta-N-acetylhexosaminidase [Rhodospirillales bacterium]